jgi:hypothetical protein
MVAAGVVFIVYNTQSSLMSVAYRVVLTREEAVTTVIWFAVAQKPSLRTVI